MSQTNTTASRLMQLYTQFCEKINHKPHAEVTDEMIHASLLSLAKSQGSPVTDHDGRSLECNSVFPTKNLIGLFDEFINFCDKTTRLQIAKYMLKHFDFKFFNACFIMSLYEMYDCEDISDKLCRAEQKYDNYRGEQHDDYEWAMDNGMFLRNITEIIQSAQPSYNGPRTNPWSVIKMRKLIDEVFYIPGQKVPQTRPEIPLELTSEQYERIWNRVLVLEPKIKKRYESDSESISDNDTESDNMINVARM